MFQCKTLGCVRQSHPEQDFCPTCLSNKLDKEDGDTKAMSARYPQYYKDVSDFDEVDVYAIHHLFDIQDPSGCIQHASKKLLLSGVRTGGKSTYKDIKEARDTLSRWLQLNPAYE